MQAKYILNRYKFALQNYISSFKINIYSIEQAKI